MRVLDLFSGIGGFSLGLERAGMTTAAFCEIEPFCRQVLAKHWPGVPIYEDVRTLTAERLAADGIAVDVVCGGFPCQDISAAGRGAGLDGARSGLWHEYARVIREVRPSWVLIENSDRLRTRGADRVFSDLETEGYTWWSGVVGAAHAGAPHRRSRVYILAHSDSQQHQVGGPEIKWPSAEVISFDADSGRHWLSTESIRAGWNGSVYAGWWTSEPALDRVAYGISRGVDRLRALGNAVVPAIPEMIGRAILAAERVHA